MKKKTQFILGILIGSIFTFPIVIYGATTLYDAIEVAYDNTSSGTTKTEVQGAIDELYEMSKTHCPDGYICTKPTGVEVLLSKANDDSITSYNSGNKGEMYTFHHEATFQTPALTDYHYIGNIPNNYITYNNETWRIIGVFDGRIKIVKDTSIGNMYWDDKQSEVGSSYSDTGSSDWTDSQLMYMLNPTTFTLKNGYTNDGIYIRDTNGKIVYQLGCLPANTDGSSYSCAQNTWSLSDTALAQADTVTYYLGGSSFSGHNAESYYSFERGNTKYAELPIKWEGKVGLMYPSDYAYTYAYGVDNTCYTNSSNCDSGNPETGWLYNSAWQWTMTSYSSYYGNVFFVGSGGSVYDAGYTNSNYGVRPTVHLRSDIELSGSGTSNDPYIIKN